jgi:hypothetical protein
MAALDVIASELLKSANEADLNYKKTRDQAQRDKAVRLRKIVENLRLVTFGASDLDELTDVTISAPVNGQVLTYNSSTGQWENQANGGGGGVTQIVAGTNISITPAGGTGVVTINADLGSTGDYGSFYSNINQPIVAPNTPQVVTIGSTYEANGVSTIGGKIYFSNAGKYQFSYVAQVSSLSNAQETAVFWIRYNGVDYPHSATTITLQPRKTSVLPSEQLMTAIFTGTALNDNDYIELWWQSTSATSNLQYVPASGTYPETPSVIANVIPVGGGGGGESVGSKLYLFNNL